MLKGIIFLSCEYVEADTNGERFTLPEDHVAVLADEDSPFFIGAYPGLLQGLALEIENPFYRFFQLPP